LGECQTIAVTKDSKFSFAGEKDGIVLKIFIQNLQVLQKWTQVIPGQITAIRLTKDDKNIFLYSGTCGLKMVSCRGGKVIKDFGEVHLKSLSGGAKGILVTRDGQWLFAIAYTKGAVKQFRVKDGALMEHSLEGFF
jgi:hypothetical protein